MIAILDYGAGNLHSVLYGFMRVGAKARIVADSTAAARADRLVIPGTGRAGSAMRKLRESGLSDVLKQAFRAGTPILGICIGAQLVLDFSEEDDTSGLGLIAGETRAFRHTEEYLKIPHMGWNRVDVTRPHPLLAPLSPADEMYFVHAFYPDPAAMQDCLAYTRHGVRFCSVLGRDNLFATQFHLEKSGRIGLEMLAAYARWDGQAPHA